MDRKVFHSVCIGALLVTMGPAVVAASVATESQNLSFAIPAQDLGSALNEFSRQSGEQLLFAPALVEGRRAHGLDGTFTPTDALHRLLSGTGVGVRSTGGAFVLVAAQSTSTPAQPPSPPQSSEAPTESLQEVVVTAQRREELEQNVPVSIIAINADQLEQNNIQTLADITKLTPAVRVDYEGTFVQPTIRGIGTNFQTTGSGSNVGMYVDGYLVPSPLAQDFQLLNVEGVQVLEGPQGTLFGRNTTAGAILVTTSEPKKDPSAMAEASYESYDTQRYKTYLTAGVDKFAVDLSGLFTKSNGYVHNIANGSDDFGASESSAVRVGAKFTPSDDVSLLFRYTHTHVQDPSSLLYGAYVYQGQPQVTGAIVPGNIIATRPNDVAEVSPPVFNITTDAYQLTGKFNLGFANLTSYTQYRKETSLSSFDADYTYDPLEGVSFSAKENVFSQELIATSTTTDPLQWTAGAFYFDWKDNFPATDVTIGGGPPQYVNTTYADTWSLAGYADATYEIIDKLFLTAGVRYTHDVVADAHYIAGALSGGPYQINYPTLTNNKATTRAVVRYELDKSSSVYASFSQGYKAGLVDMSGPANVTIKPETLNAYEIGYKLATARLSADLSAYYYSYKDLQTAINELGFLSFRNAANSRIYGVEGQLRYLLTPKLELSTAAAYLNAKYKSYPVAVGFLQCLTPACGASYGSFLQTTVNASGFDMLRAPDFSETLSLAYKVDIGRSRLALSGNWYYTSRFYFDTSEQFPQSSYNLLGLRAEWTDPSGRFTLAVYGNNLTDSHYVQAVESSTLGTGAVWAAPAIVGGSVRVRL